MRAGEVAAEAQVNLDTLRVAAEMTPAAALRQVTLRVDVPAGDLLAVYGVAADLARAFGNLATNAVRHIDPQLTVCFLGRRAEDGRVQGVGTPLVGKVCGEYRKSAAVGQWRPAADGRSIRPPNRFRLLEPPR